MRRIALAALALLALASCSLAPANDYSSAPAASCGGGLLYGWSAC